MFQGPIAFKAEEDGTTVAVGPNGKVHVADSASLSHIKFLETFLRIFEMF